MQPWVLGRALHLGPHTLSVTLSGALSLGMTVEMAGTLMGATVHGLIVSGAHRPHRCEATVTPGPVTVSASAVSAWVARTRNLVSPLQVTSFL